MRPKKIILFKTIYLPIHTWILLLFYLLTYANAFAQATLPLKNYTINEGLPSSEVYHVMQDSKGFMWFSTDHGVCRYDGYKFKTFTTADGLADNTIFECREDAKGRIWFRSYSGKLSYYYHDSIFSLPINEKLKKILGPSLVTSFVIDSSDNLYLGTIHWMQGFIKIDLKHKNSIQLIPLPRDIIYIVKIPGSNQLISGATYLEGDKYLSMDSTNLLAMYTLSFHDSIPVKQFEIPIQEKNIFHIQTLQLPDSEISLSIGKSFFLLHNNKIIYTHHFNTIVIYAYPDPSGKIWITLQYEVPVCYNHFNIEHLPLLKTIKEKQITSTAIDAEGGLWLTSQLNGIYYASSLQFISWTKENGLWGNKINFMNIAPDSSLWISASPGNVISVINKDTNITYRTIGELSNISTINTILFNKDHTVWLSCGSKTFLYNMSNFTSAVNFKSSPGGKGLIQNADGTLWSNTTGNLYILKQKKDSLTIFKNIKIGAVIKKILKEQDNIIWLATTDGLYQYVNNTLINWGTIYPVLKKRMDDIALLPNGDLWIATRDTGLILKSKNHLRYYNTKNGLSNNFSHCLTFDYTGNLWVGTNDGLSHLFMHYDKQGNCMVDSIKNITLPFLKEINYVTCNKNTVYAGTNNGLISFDMNTISLNKTQPPVYITELQIDNKKFPISTKNPYLNYDENNIIITYVGLTYRDASNTLYRYRMKGIDTTWIYTQYTVVQYPKLPPGKYSFMVSARNSDGVWSTNDATISFIISPPLWGMWWVKLLLAISIALLIYWRVKAILKRDRAKAETSQKIIEMQLRELREQMDPHFLFNTLNTLTYLVESKSPNAPIFVDELSKYFRYSLQFRNVEFTELHNELKQAKRYTNLLKIRYGDGLLVNWEIDTIMAGYFISNHSLQILLENITKHNVVSNESPLIVEIKTTSNNSLLVKNNIQPKTGKEESTGLGLKSIDERYYLLFNKKIKINHTSNLFLIELPLITPDEYESTLN